MKMRDLYRGDKLPQAAEMPADFATVMKFDARRA